MKNTVKLALMAVCAAMAMSVCNQALAQPTGDGVSPYNLKWEDPDKGIVSFLTPLPQPRIDNDTKISYSVYITKVGQEGAGGASRNMRVERIGEGQYKWTADFAYLLTGEGTYYFEAVASHMEDDPDFKRIVVRSENYTIRGRAATIGDPANLRFEITGSEVWALWDNPDGFVEGRDYYLLQVWSLYLGPSRSGHVLGDYGPDTLAYSIPNTGSNRHNMNKIIEEIDNMRLDAQYIAESGASPEKFVQAKQGPFVLQVKVVSGSIEVGASSLFVWSSVAYDRVNNRVVPVDYPAAGSNFEKIDR